MAYLFRFFSKWPGTIAEIGAGASLKKAFVVDVIFSRKNGFKDWENLQEHQVRFSDFFHDYVTMYLLVFTKLHPQNPT